MEKLKGLSHLVLKEWSFMLSSLPVKSYARIDDVRALPKLIEVQLDSFRWFQTEGLRELFDEISPIQSFNKNL